MKHIWKAATVFAGSLLMIPGSASAADASGKCSIVKILTLPVTMIGRQPTVPVALEDHKLRMVLDSGAFFSTIPLALAKQLDLSLHDAPPGAKIAGVGGTADILITSLKNVTLGGQTIHNVDFLVGGSETGQSGLLGENVLGFADAEYDLPDGVVRLMRAKGDCEENNLAYWSGDKPYSVIKIAPGSYVQHHIVGMVELNGVKMKAMFDTGASTTILTREAAEKVGFKPNGPGVVEGEASHGLGSGTAQTWIAPFDELKLGNNEAIKKIKLQVGDFPGLGYDMLIGADFFLSHRVFVANSIDKMFITYQGGPVFDLTSHGNSATSADRAATAGGAASASNQSSGEPTSAQEYSGRGNARATRHQYAAAKSDLDHAIAMAPNVARYHVQRARIEFETDDRKAASSDLDQAIGLDPKDVDALIMRANVRISDDDISGAKADARMLDQELGQQSDRRVALANIYNEVDEPKLSIANYSLWIDSHPRDSGLADAYNGRCWTRALNGIDVEDAIHDCNHALSLSPHDPAVLDSRGWAHLRANDPKEAIEDYDDALKVAPKQASSLYGRGLARRRLGDTSLGDKDIAAAKAIDKDVAQPFDRHGIKR